MKKSKLLGTLLATSLVVTQISTGCLGTLSVLAAEATATEAAESTTEATAEEQVRAFVERMYTCALNRKADPKGLEDWTTSLLEQKNDGAGLAFGFMQSDEFKNNGLSNEDYVKVMYKTFFDREPDQAGFDSWVKVLDEGGSRENVLQGFVNSKEFAKLCSSFGILQGYMYADGRAADPGIAQFVSRLYSVVLGRDGDPDGLFSWTEQIASDAVSAEYVATTGFFASAEFSKKQLNNAQFVSLMYKTYFDRGYDKAGYDYWIWALECGTTREMVELGFARSLEFNKLLNSFGLEGSTDASDLEIITEPIDDEQYAEYDLVSMVTTAPDGKLMYEYKYEDIAGISVPCWVYYVYNEDGSKYMSTYTGTILNDDGSSHSFDVDLSKDGKLTSRSDNYYDSNGSTLKKTITQLGMSYSDNLLSCDDACYYLEYNYEYDAEGAATKITNTGYYAEYTIADDGSITVGTHLMDWKGETLSEYNESAHQVTKTSSQSTQTFSDGTSWTYYDISFYTYDKYHNLIRQDYNVDLMNKPYDKSYPLSYTKYYLDNNGNCFREERSRNYVSINNELFGTDMYYTTTLYNEYALPSSRVYASDIEGYPDTKVTMEYTIINGQAYLSSDDDYWEDPETGEWTYSCGTRYKYDDAGNMIEWTRITTDGSELFRYTIEGFGKDNPAVGDTYTQIKKNYDEGKHISTVTYTYVAK